MNKELERLRARIATSPLVKLLEIRLMELREGYAQLALEVKEKHLNSLGTLHGGVMATTTTWPVAWPSTPSLPLGPLS